MAKNDAPERITARVCRCSTLVIGINACPHCGAGWAQTLVGPTGYIRERADLVAPDALGMNTNWPLKDVLNTLADAVEHLGRVHDCDCDGWEIPQGVIPIARNYTEKLSAIPDAVRQARPAILVSAEWIVGHHKNHYDGGCSECVGEDLHSDFICVYHRAAAALRAEGEKGDE